MGVPAVAAIRNDLMPAMRVEWPSEELFDTALASLVASGRRAISLVDEVSFETMRRRGLQRAFAFDVHFAQRGFELVPAAE
jgi:predicted nucleic acid-binding protein